MDRTLSSYTYYQPWQRKSTQHTSQRFSRNTRWTKRGQYNRCVMEVEHGSFTPLLFTTSGIMSHESTIFHKSLNETRWYEEVCEVYKSSSPSSHSKRHFYVSGGHVHARRTMYTVRMALWNGPKWNGYVNIAGTCKVEDWGSIWLLEKRRSERIATWFIRYANEEFFV